MNEPQSAPRETVTVVPGTIAVFSDLTCPFAHVAIHRLFETRTRLGLDDNRPARPSRLPDRTPERRSRHPARLGLRDPGSGRPRAGRRLANLARPRLPHPSTVLPAFEAVQAAKAQSLAISERLDRALRCAFWAQSRPIHLHNELITVASTVDGIDVDDLDRALRRGTYRHRIFDDLDVVRSGAVSMSPHLFLPNGTDIANPGIQLHWQGPWAAGFPVIDSDDPGIYEALLRTALPID